VKLPDKQRRFVFEVRSLTICEGFIELLFAGEFPETFIDPSLGNLMLRLRQALGSILSVSTNKIAILAVRPVQSHRRFHDRPLTLAEAKAQALLDVFFSVPSWSQYQIEHVLNVKMSSFQTQFGIMANISGPDPCEDHLCPHGKKFSACDRSSSLLLRHDLSIDSHDSTETVCHRY
jgi:hypothetical protein